jgi:hypothetical protein
MQQEWEDEECIWRPIEFWDFEDPTFARQLADDDSEVVSLTRRPLVL